MFSSSTISVVSYNLLSDELCSDQFHLNAREDDRICNTSRRYGLILEKFDKLNKDVIICMQEVSRNWSCQLLQYFYDKNYTYIPSTYGNQWNGYMGVAIAFCNEVYQLKSCDIKRIGDLVPTDTETETWATWAMVQLASGIQSTYHYCFDTRLECLKPFFEESFQQIAAKRYNTLLGVELESKNSSEGCLSRSQSFLVSTYHMPCLFANEKVMVTHALLTLNYAIQRSISISQVRGHEVPFILAGDFNFQPHDSAYALMTNGWYCWHHHSDSSVKFLRNLECAGELKSAYAEVEGKEPDYTNRVLTKNNRCFEGTLDYIFYHGNLKPVAVRPLYCPKNEYFPNLKEPSDHLMIGATFNL